MNPEIVILAQQHCPLDDVAEFPDVPRPSISAPNRLYFGFVALDCLAGPTAELTAWIRLVVDDEPPDEARLVVLLDSLAPSYAAVLSTLAPIPTIELTVRPTAALASAASPWVLVRARTNVAGESGWIDETLDAWGPDGVHLAHGSQLRLLAR